MVFLMLYSSVADDKYQLVHWCNNCYFWEDDGYITIMLNPNWKVKLTVQIEVGCLQVLTCKWHNGGYNKMVLYAPQILYNHVLNAEQSDHLAPCVSKHLVSKPMMASEYCTKFQMFQQHTEFVGVSTMDCTVTSFTTLITTWRCISCW